MVAGWINSLTNYALIAAGQQAKLTRAFIITLIFNAIANLIFIPPFSYIGAAVVTIASEIVKGTVFYYFVRAHIAPLPWTRILAWPALCSGIMALISGAIVATTGQFLLGVLAGAAVYAAAAWFGGALTPDERAAVRQLVRRQR
jgi:O-antigen/teichoic acid export membrane protein